MPAISYLNPNLSPAELTLLNAALNLLLRHPVDHTSVTLVHRTAGLSKTTFYQYFSGKKDLWCGLLLEEQRTRLALLDDLPSQPGQADWRLYFINLMQSPEKLLLLESLETRLLADPPQELRRYQEWYQHRPTLLNRLANLSEDQAPSTAKKQSMAVLWGLLEGWLHLYQNTDVIGLAGGRRQFTKLMANEMAAQMVRLHADN